MATAIPSAALVPVTPVFTNTELLALAGFLAGYSGLTRQAYELDLRQYASWCQHHQLRLFAARRADIECFARDLEARGRARATITRRLSTAAGFYRYAVEALGVERAHRTMVVTRKGGKVVTVPLAPRTARAIDLAIGERVEGPVFLTAGGRRLDRHGAGRIAGRIARQAGIVKSVGPHTLRHAFITAAQRRGVASDATFRVRREDGAVRDAGPGADGRRSRRQNEPAGQDGRDRTALCEMPGCCVHSRCIRAPHDAADATKSAATRADATTGRSSR
jgi:site-specific recombinase XerD